MRPFSEIWREAAARKGGDAALEALVAEHPVKTSAELVAVPDHRWLAQMSKCVFQAGFSWKVIETKWPGFERAFHAFDPKINAVMSDDELDEHLKDTGIIRNAQKIISVRNNAAFLVDLAHEHGSAAAFFAAWPDSDFIGLLDVMKARASRLSGETAMRLFRFMGKASFITSRRRCADHRGRGRQTAQRQEGSAGGAGGVQRLGGGEWPRSHRDQPGAGAQHRPGGLGALAHLP
jgi:3-methyladenine DNA glycosylase Tag